MLDVELGVVVGTIALGLAHGIEPGHGWPVAASYALDQTNKWLYGFAASFLLGVGHLISSLAMVAAFFWAKRYFDLAQVNDPMTVSVPVVAETGVRIGGPVSVVAGVLLILLGVREYFHGHSHGRDHSHGDHDHGHDHSHEHHEHDEHLHTHDHEHGDGQGHEHPDSHEHGYSHDHEHTSEHDHSHLHGHDSDNGVLARVKTLLPFVGGHSHGSMEDATDRGLWGIAGFAFLLGFAHEEEIEIILLCSGSQYCLELMTVYALTVIVGIVGLTLLLIAGYQRYEKRAERYAEYLPAFSAAVLILMGVGFVTGLF